MRDAQTVYGVASSKVSSRLCADSYHATGRVEKELIAVVVLFARNVTLYGGCQIFGCGINSAVGSLLLLQPCEFTSGQNLLQLINFVSHNDPSRENLHEFDRLLEGCTCAIERCAEIYVVPSIEVMTCITVSLSMVAKFIIFKHGCGLPDNQLTTSIVQSVYAKLVMTSKIEWNILKFVHDNEVSSSIHMHAAIRSLYIIESSDDAIRENIKHEIFMEGATSQKRWRVDIRKLSEIVQLLSIDRLGQLQESRFSVGRFASNAAPVDEDSTFATDLLNQSNRHPALD
jgi:hypothetical protein